MEPVAVAARRDVRGRGQRGAPSAQRRDIQGLRAVAVVLVLAFHAGVRFVPGGYVGVDVFFVISGFLITGLIVREVRSAGHLNLGRFYARRARRLLPATAVTFVGVALVTVLVLPVTRWASVAGDMVASALYVVNWRLAARSVEYFAQGAAASPLQHFWSLAVEEQFYIVWPLLIVALTWWARRRRRSAAVDGERGLSVGRLTAGLLVIVLPSLAWSVYLTATDPGPAFFVTTTRLWELGIGALLAVGAVQAARAPVVVRAVAGWVGLAAIGWSAVMFTAETRFPGSAALVPTLGAAAVLWAGLGDGRARVRVLDVAPLQDVGALSYSLYLWHWPVLVAATALWGDKDGHLWLPTALLAVAASAVPAWFAYRVVEQPLHMSPLLAAPWRAGVAGVVCVAIGLGSAGAITWSLDRKREISVSAPTPAPDLFGAAALGDDPATSPAGVPVDSVSSIVPDPIDAAGDNADPYNDGCHQDQEKSEVLSCTYGDPASDVTVALVGDSHAAQWEPALRVLAEENGWRLDTYTKSACLFADVDVWLPSVDGPYASCAAWSANVTAKFVSAPPDVVVVSTSGSYAAADATGPLTGKASFDALASGVARMWQELRAGGSTVAVITDSPRPKVDMPECVGEHRDKLVACAFSHDGAVARSAAALQEAAASEVTAGVEMIDLTDYICPQAECPAVIGGVLVFRDSHHLTGTYVKSLAPMLGRRIVPIIAAAH